MLQNARFTAFTAPELLKGKLAGVGKIAAVHSTSWKFSLHFIHIFRADWMLFNKFGSSDPSSSRSILTILYLRAQIAAIH